MTVLEDCVEEWKNGGIKEIGKEILTIKLVRI